MNSTGYSKVAFRLVVLATGIWLVSAVVGRAQPQLMISVEGNAKVVFNWKKQACNAADSPDTGARAFRDSAGNIQLFASYFQTRRLSGASFEDLSHHCEVSLTSQENSDPAAFRDFSWISSTYTEDGKAVYALLHNEYQGHRRPDRCNLQVYVLCWRNSITLAISKDGGITFDQPELSVVATLPYTYLPNPNGNSGYFNPTNIVKRGEYYYTIFAATEYKAQKYGLCIMRTRNLSDPTSWRAWDGTDYSVIFLNPYENKIEAPEKHVCAPIGAGMLGANQSSLVFHPESKLYLLTLAMRANVDGVSVPGFYFATSEDLLRWTKPKLIWKTQVAPIDLSGSCEAIDMYPSIIDHDSLSRNFETVGTGGWIYFSRYYLNEKNCNGTARRDLLRIPIKLTLKS